MSEIIISFEEYRKKKRGTNYKKDALSSVFEKDLRDQTELIDWYIFHSKLNKYKLYIHSLFKENDLTFRQLGEQLTGDAYSRNYEAREAIRKELLYSDKVFIISELSKMKSNIKKESVVGFLIKTIDDAHFDNITPKSQLVFIDYAKFLQKTWKYIGSYLKVTTAFD
ncbi:MAG: hypothetical protein KAX49_05230 [Halanaerobiales bacterium]|nr:hypothetical protein [Halanaerobiales bacterium]